MHCMDCNTLDTIAPGKPAAGCKRNDGMGGMAMLRQLGACPC